MSKSGGGLKSLFEKPAVKICAVVIAVFVCAVAGIFVCANTAQGLSGRSSTIEVNEIVNYAEEGGGFRRHKIHLIGDTWCYCVHDGPNYEDGVTANATEANAKSYLGQDLLTELALVYDYVWTKDLFRTPGGERLANDYQRHAVTQCAIRAYCMRDGLLYSGAFHANCMYIGKRDEGGIPLTGWSNLPGVGGAQYVASESMQKIYNYVAANKNKYIGHGEVAKGNVNQEVLCNMWLEPLGTPVQAIKTGTSGNASVDAAYANNPNYDLSGAQFTLYNSQNTNDRAVNTDGETFVLTISRQSNGTYKSSEVTMEAGTYYVRETRGPNAGYLRDTDGDGTPDVRDANPTDNWYELVVPDNGEVKTFTWNNPPATPSVKVIKTGSSGKAGLDARVEANPYYDLTGAQFTLYNSRNTNDRARNVAGNTFVLTVHRNSDGTYSTNEENMVPGTYYIRETKAPNKGYLIDTDGDGTPDVEDPNPTDYWYSITLPADNNVHSAQWNDPPFFPEVDLEKFTSKADTALFEAVKDNPCYDILGAQFTLYETDGSEALDINNVPVVLTVNSSEEQGAVGKTNKFKILPGNYYLRETKAPNKGFRLDADGDGRADEDEEMSGSDTSGHKNIKVTLEDQTFTWSDPPMFDPQPLYLLKRDSTTGQYFKVPQGDGDLNGAEYRISYYKGVYTRVDQLPSTPDATAVWTTRSYTVGGKTYSGAIDLAVDAPSSGTWKYRDALTDVNYSPLGTLAIQEISAPTGYLVDPEIHLLTLTDDGTHRNANILSQPYNQDGTPGNDDWNSFANQYELNGDQSGVETWYD